MKFITTRTSNYSYRPPCEEAINIDKNVYIVKLDSLEQLLAFSDKYGDLIITDNPASIEIYDDYRE